MRKIFKEIFLSLIFRGMAVYLIVVPLLISRNIFAADKKKYNILFIAIDDLKPLLGCYGATQIKSPNIDRLARNGALFTNSYCQIALCCPSRSSLLTGLRPDSTKVYGNLTHFRNNVPDVIALPQYFKNNGYHVRAFGKVYHGGFDDTLSWSEPAEYKVKPPEPVATSLGGYFTKEGMEIMNELNEKFKEASKKEADPLKRQHLRQRLKMNGLPCEAPDVPDDQLGDGAVARRAVQVLNEIKNMDKPFFLAVGFIRPHMPFIAPKKYYDMYSLNDIKLAENPLPPQGAPSYALKSSSDPTLYYGVPREGPFPDDIARKLIHGYYASISFTDAQVGRVINELERLGLRENTIIILWGDNGWHLGDHGLWGKATNYEQSARVPLIISVPGQKFKGTKIDAPVEFVDIYPTLTELCGLSLPGHLEGISFVPLLESPKLPWKKAAFTQYPKNIPGKGNCMGYSIRTERYRFTEWKIPEKDFCEIELYDYKNDPLENVNIANLPENAKVVDELKKLLEGGWKGVLPPDYKGKK